MYIHTVRIQVADQRGWIDTPWYGFALLHSAPAIFERRGYRNIWISRLTISTRFPLLLQVSIRISYLLPPPSFPLRYLLSLNYLAGLAWVGRKEVGR